MSSDTKVIYCRVAADLHGWLVEQAEAHGHTLTRELAALLWGCRALVDSGALSFLPEHYGVVGAPNADAIEREVAPHQLPKASEGGEPGHAMPSSPKESSTENRPGGCFDLHHPEAARR